MSIQTYFGNDADDDIDDEEKDIIAEGMSGSIRYHLRSHVLTREVSPAISFSDRWPGQLASLWSSVLVLNNAAEYYRYYN